jgi:hypothetical protein
MIVTSFWTAGTPYEAEAKELVATLDKFGLKHDVREYPHPGTWAKAACLFPLVILETRRRHPDEDIMFLDADARVTTLPVRLAGLAEEGFDAGLYWLPNSPRSVTPDKRELCTGTTWWAATPTADAILEAWFVECRKPETEKLLGVDQEALQLLLPRFPQASIFELPPEYCWMDRISEMHYGKREPVIAHGQASRRFRKQVSTP